MGTVRIHWQTLGKLVAAGAVALLGLQLLPGLLRAPQPPPLEADVGLPRVPAGTRPERALPPGRTLPPPRPAGERRPSPLPGVKPKVARRQPHPRRAQKPAASPPAAAPPATPALPPPPSEAAAAAPPPPLQPAPPPAPPPTPEPAPPAGDGSEEFAPH